MDIFGAHSHSVPKHRQRLIHSLSFVFSAIRLYLSIRTVSKTCSKNAGRVLFIRFDVILSLNFPLVHLEAYVNVNTNVWHALRCFYYSREFPIETSVLDSPLSSRYTCSFDGSFLSYVFELVFSKGQCSVQCSVEFYWNFALYRSLANTKHWETKQNVGNRVVQKFSIKSRRNRFQFIQFRNYFIR